MADGARVGGTFAYVAPPIYTQIHIRANICVFLQADGRRVG